MGIDAPSVSVEVHITNGMPSLSIVGLPETAVKESKDRVRSAIINSGFEFPVRRITINLAPADLPKKNGGRYDLPIALGILLASKQLIATDINTYEFAGELALDGSLRSFSGVLPLALATKMSRRALVVPRGSAFEAGLVRDMTIFVPTHLLEIVAHLAGAKKLAPLIGETTVQRRSYLELSDIHGQNHAKRALEIVAAGGHSLFMIGLAWSWENHDC